MQPISCPHCRGEFDVSDNAVGHETPCPYCERSLFISAPAGNDVEGDYDAPPRRMQPATKAMLGFFGFALGVGLIMGIVALARRSSEPEKQPMVVSRTVPLQQSPTRPAPAPTSPAAEDFEEEAKATVFLGLSAFFSWLLFLSVLGLFFTVAEILILVWVVKDARARGADGSVWLIAMLLMPLVGLVVYLISRPPGLLVPCVRCGNRRLDYLRACPICQHVAERPAWNSSLD